MRRFLTTALLASFALPLVIASAARAADYDYPYEPGPPRDYGRPAYERPVEPPFVEERPVYRSYDRPYVRRYPHPFYGRPFDDEGYSYHRHHWGHYGYAHRFGPYGYAPY